jgi:hypothetical protein
MHPALHTATETSVSGLLGTKSKDDLGTMQCDKNTCKNWFFTMILCSKAYCYMKNNVAVESTIHKMVTNQAKN